MRLRVYLDTSVFSAFLDDAVQVRQRETQDLFARLGDYEASTSEIGREELMRTPDRGLRDRLRSLLEQVNVIELTPDMRQLAESYLQAGVFTSAMFMDSLHVAAAVLSRQDVLLSWNFRHLVNRRRRALIAELNTLLGLPSIEILAPPEL